MSLSPYLKAKEWAQNFPMICTPAQDKRPLGDNHPKTYRHRGAGVYGAAADWARATGFCVMPLPPYIAIDFDDASALLAALRVQPSLSKSTFVVSPKGMHVYVRLDAPDAYWRIIPRSIVSDGRERASVRGGYWNTYLIGPGSVRSDGAFYEAPSELSAPVTLSAFAMTKLLRALGASLAPPPPSAPLSRKPSFTVDGGRLREQRYIERTFEGAIRDVATAVEGTRNNTLYRKAWKLFALVKAGYLDEGDVRNSLMQAALSAGLPHHEVMRTLQSAWRSAPCDRRL